MDRLHYKNSKMLVPFHLFLFVKKAKVSYGSIFKAIGNTFWTISLINNEPFCAY